MRRSAQERAADAEADRELDALVLRFRRGARNLDTLEKRLARVAETSRASRSALAELACGALDDAHPWRAALERVAADAEAFARPAEEEEDVS